MREREIDRKKGTKKRKNLKFFGLFQSRLDVSENWSAPVIGHCLEEKNVY